MLSGAGHEGACYRGSRTFAAFIPHWREWPASLSGRFIHLLHTHPGKSSIPMERGEGTPEVVWTFRRRQNIFAPAGNGSTRRPTWQSSRVRYYLIYLVMFTTVCLFNDTFSGSKRRTSKGGIKGFGIKR